MPLSNLSIDVYQEKQEAEERNRKEALQEREKKTQKQKEKLNKSE